MILIHELTAKAGRVWVKKIDENIDKYRDNVIYCCKTLDNCRVSSNRELTGD